MGSNKKLSLWGDILNQKPKKQTQPQGNVWEVTVRNANGAPAILCKNGKEWFHADKTWPSPSGAYYIHTGMDGNANEGIATTTKNEGIRIRKTEDFVEAALITDEGVGYAITDEGVLYVLTADTASGRRLCEDYEPNTYMLAPQLCAVIYDADSDDDLEAAYLKVIDLKSFKSWKKKIRYSAERGKNLIFKIEQSGSIIKAIMPDQSVHEFTTDGKIIK